MRYRSRVGLGALALLLAAGLPAPADDRAEALLRQTREAMSKLKSLSADVETSSGTSVSKATVALKRPNLARVEMQGGENLVVSDGTNRYMFLRARNQYLKGEPGADGSRLGLPFGDPVNGFFQPGRIGMEGSGALGVSRTYVGREKLDGVDYDVVEVSLTQPRQQTVRYFISPKDRLIHQTVLTVKLDDRAINQTVRLKNIKTDVDLAASLFQWTPPATAKLYAPPAPRDFAADLVPVGQPAPDFNLPVAGGGQLSLSDTLKGKKAVLVNFWFYG